MSDEQKRDKQKRDKQKRDKRWNTFKKDWHNYQKNESVVIVTLVLMGIFTFILQTSKPERFTQLRCVIFLWISILIFCLAFFCYCNSQIWLLYKQLFNMIYYEESLKSEKQKIKLSNKASSIMVLKSRLLLVLISSMGILELIDIVLPAFKLPIEPDTWSLISGSIGTILTAVAAYLGLTKYQIGRKGLDHLLMKVNYDTYKTVFIDPIHDYQSISKRIMAIISTVIICTSYPIFDNQQIYYSGYAIANGYFL